MMAPVDPMKLTPVPRSKRTQNGVVQEIGLASIFFFGQCDDRVHRRNLGGNLGAHLIGREPSWHRILRSFSALWQVIETENNEGPNAIPPYRDSSQRLSGLQTLFETLDGSGVAQVKVLQDFSRAPFALGMAQERFVAQIFGRRGDGILESLQIEIHGGVFSFV